MTQEIFYALECGHAAPSRAMLVNGTLECAWHQEPSPIKGVITYEWKATCLNCKYARWAGISKHNAQIFANGHALRNPEHKLIVEYTENPEAVHMANRLRMFRGR